jgi:hypothetical protein
MIVTRLYPSVIVDLGESYLNESWNFTVEALRTYQDHNRSAERYLITLELLHEKVVGDGPVQDELDAALARPSRADSGLHVHAAPHSRVNDPLESQESSDIGAVFDVRDMAWLDSTPFDLDFHAEWAHQLSTYTSRFTSS